MEWIPAHVAYDDVHPVKALGLIHQLLGDAPSQEAVVRIRGAIEKSYDLYLLVLDEGMNQVPQNS